MIQAKSNKADNNEDAKPKKKKVTLEGLILSGREALAADGAGDVSDEDGDEDGETEEGGFHRYRADSVRAALAAGDVIPDAALIHAARKSRQQVWRGEGPRAGCAPRFHANFIFSCISSWVLDSRY